MNYFIACLSMTLAALIAAQIDVTNRPLMNGYHGLAVVFIGLLIVAIASLIAEMNNQAVDQHNR